MLVDFFKLNNPYQDILTLAEFERQIAISPGFMNLRYMPNQLAPSVHPKLKIKDKSFTNFSFSKTLIQNVHFINCKFVDCLFIGTTIKSCEFHNCTFRAVNTYKLKIEDSYIDPGAFVKCFNSLDKSNIATNLFQQLLQNSNEQGQAKFSRIAEYNFNKWKDRLLLYKLTSKGADKISFWTFAKEYPLNWLFRWTFGYGLRFRNFVVTFLVSFISFFLLNFFKWQSYSLVSKDLKIDSFNPDSASITSNFLYTMDITTKLIDSQFQPTSDTGMFWLTFQSISAFILLSALITILVKRFVK